MKDEIKLISVDMFQTLVDVHCRCFPFWKQVLGAEFNEEAAREYWSMIPPFLAQQYEQIFEEGRFIPAQIVAKKVFTRMFKVLELDVDAAWAAKIFIREHGNAELFFDTEKFLQTAGKHYPLCLVSDADEEMLGELGQMYNFDRIFISEQVGAYKNSSGGELFHSVTCHYGLNPAYILHIGDSPFDVLGARRAGMKTCWLNRCTRKWLCDVKPDFMASSLLDVLLLLGL